MDQDRIRIRYDKLRTTSVFSMLDTHNPGVNMERDFGRRNGNIKRPAQLQLNINLLKVEGRRRTYTFSTSSCAHRINQRVMRFKAAKY